MKALAILVAVLAFAPPAAAMRWLDTPGHVIQVPGNIGPVEATGPLTDVPYTVTVDPPDETASCAPTSFPVGTTPVTCTAADADPQTFNVTVQDTTLPQLNLPGTVSVEATALTGNNVAYPFAPTDAVGVTSSSCTPAAGPNFPLGSTTVQCQAADAAGNNASGSFVVDVVDTTPPAFSTPAEVNVTTESAGGRTVDFSAPTATDLQGSVGVACTPASGAHFDVGTTLVTCTASDGRGNTGSVGFDVVVTLVDTTPPVLHGVPGNIAQDTEVPAGKIVTFTAPTATDNIDGTDAVSCTKNSGDLFPVGTTTVTCTATDAHGNSASGTFDVVITLVDHTKPVLRGVPANIVDTTESPSGKAVTYTPPTANDNLDGPLPVACDHAPGSTFPLGTTTVKCSATDAHGNKQEASFTVTLTLIDITAPVLTGVSPDRIVEANGPTGAVVTFATPSANDNLDGPIALVSCTPASGSLFSLGAHVVTCSATDAHLNTGTAKFVVTVADTTPPVLAVPGPATVAATTPTGIAETAPALLAFRAAAKAKDIVDASPVIGDNLGSFVEVGVHTAVFSARDASGNVSYKETQLTVLPQPAAGTPPLPLPPPAKLPADVAKLQVFPGDGFVRIVWGAAPNAVLYLVYRSEGGARRLTDSAHGQLVYSGTATTYTDRSVANGVEYRYVVVARDAAGNESTGVAAAAMPHRSLLRSPKDGARLKKPPKLVWARNVEAAYYNVQLYRGEKKILSTWPLRPSMQLKRTWKYEGRRYTLGKGVYRWYVWPGFGARAAVDYGELMGSSSFELTR